MLKFPNSFHEINQFSVARCVTLSSGNTFEIHGLSDASTLVYAAAIYCRKIYNGKTEVVLLISKTKVSPIKKFSIPKLELCIAHLLSYFIQL